MDTIVAIATPPGFGGVAVIRLSGPLAYSIAIHLTKKQSLSIRQAHYCSFYDTQGDCIDKGLVLYFKSPHSFTGEDVVELQGHASPIVLQHLLSLCLSLGARLAKPGEFSERAFLNNKIDLAQAEAIADLIHASSQTAARLAMRSLDGVFSKRINSLSQQIVNLRLYVEAAIDFPEEDIDFLNDGKIASALSELLNSLTLLRMQSTQGALLREGATLVIAGRPNVGKSTLINALSGRDVAIVTDIPGTTRDIMREKILLDDIPLNIIDTAGLRQTDDRVEQEGIKRAWQALADADCVLLMTDHINKESTNGLSAEIQMALPPDVTILHVMNKIDIIHPPAQHDNNTVYISAKTGEGFDVLRDRIKKSLGFQLSEGLFFARQRHLDALDKALYYLNAGMNQVHINRAFELLADDLRCAHEALSEITGEFTSDDLLGEIFSSFCIGK